MQDLQQPTTTPMNLPSVSSKGQNPNLFYATNGGQMLISSQTNSGQLPNQTTQQIYSINQNVVDASNAAFAGFRRLLAELKAKKFDQIRFAAYRTASKLRYIQKRTLLSLVELWQLLETFRELGLHLTDPTSNLNRQGTEHLLNRIYAMITPLCIEKGIAPNETSAQLVVAQANEILLGWLTYILDPTSCGRMTVSGLKVALSTLVTGKPAEKFTYHYSLMVNSAGTLQLEKLESYLQELLSLAVGVFEEPNFSYNAQTSKFLLTGKSKTLSVEEFVEKMLAEPGPQSFGWLKVFHRLGIVENVQHQLKCEGCKREPIVGLRYKCTRCPKYNLCQDCFWTGITTGSHANGHDVKEYTSATKTHSRQFGHSLRKSFQFGRQQSLPSGQASLPLTQQQQQQHQQQQMVNALGAARSPFTSYPQYRFYRPGMPPPQAMLQTTGMPPTFYYSVPAPGSKGLNRPPPTPVMQTRSFHRATSVPIQTQGAPQGPQQQAVFTQTYIATTVQPLPQPGRDSISPMAVARETSVARQQQSQQTQQQPQQIPQRHTSLTPGSSTASNLLQRQQLSGLPPQPPPPPAPPPPQRQISTDGDIGTPSVSQTNVGYCGVLAAPSNSGMSLVASKNVMEETLGRRPTLHQSLPAQHQHPLESGMFRQIPTQVDLGQSDEHKMIANYAARLVASRTLPVPGITDVIGSTQSQQELVAQLEAKNREILMEIQRLKVEQANQAAGLAAAMRDSSSKLPPSSRMQPQPPSSDIEDPQLVAELHALRQRKSELEARMNDLQGNRRDLTIQLETLMRLLKTSPGKMGKPCEDVSFGYAGGKYHQPNYYSRPRTGNALPPRRSCSLVRRSSGTRTSLDAVSGDQGHQRSLDAESLLIPIGMNEPGAGSTMSLQRRGNNRLLLSPQHQPTDVSHKSRPRNLPPSSAMFRGNSTGKQSTSAVDRWQGRGTDLLYLPDSTRENVSNSKERTPPLKDFPSGSSTLPRYFDSPQHSSKVTLELNDAQRNSSTKQREPLSISVQSHQCRASLSAGSAHAGVSTDSDVGDSSQSSRRRPYNCAAVFEPSGGSVNTVSSSSDAYLYSDPEILTTGWQDTGSGRRNPYKSSSNINSSNSVISTTASTEQTSSVTIVSAPGNKITASTTRASDVDMEDDKRNGDSGNIN